MKRILVAALVCFSMGSRPTSAREFDAETGLVHMGARDYDPSTGRFLQEDPIVGAPAVPQSLNRYSYVMNRPINMVDPLGLWGVGVTGGGGGALGFGPGIGYQIGSGVGIFGGNGSLGLGSYTYKGDYAESSYSTVEDRDFVLGASGGVGSGFFLTNATSAHQLLGPFDTWTLDTPIGSLQLAKSLSTWGRSWTTEGGIIGSWTWSPWARGISLSRFKVNTDWAGRCQFK